LPWGRLDPDTTANVGTIVGGSARNAVPEEARLEGEVRSLDAQKLRAHGQLIRSTFRDVAQAAGATVAIEVSPLYTGYRLAGDSHVVQLARRAFEALGGTATRLLTGSGSDANEFNAAGVECCVLGIGAELCHTVRERVAVSELVRLTEWVLSILGLAAREDTR
jgi:tripeptide aminopeptidase